MQAVASPDPTGKFSGRRQDMRDTWFPTSKAALDEYAPQQHASLMSSSLPPLKSCQISRVMVRGVWNVINRSLCFEDCS